MWTKGEGGLFTGSTSEGGGKYERKVASVRSAASIKSPSSAKRPIAREEKMGKHVGVHDIVSVGGRVVRGKTDVPVVINPTIYDLKEMKPGIDHLRLLKTDEGDVYAWTADVIHESVARALGNASAAVREEQGTARMSTIEHINAVNRIDLKTKTVDLTFPSEKANDWITRNEQDVRERRAREIDRRVTRQKAQQRAARIAASKLEKELLE